MHFVKYALEQWKNAGAPTVKQIATDGSKALQNAISLCYNSTSFKVYLSNCHAAVTKSTNEIPQCYIRSDIAHLIKSITRWDCFNKYNSKVKDFYIRIIGYMSKIESYSDFRKIVFDVYVICQSPKIDIEGSSSKTWSSLENLKECVKLHPNSYCEESCCCDFCIETSTLDITLEDEDFDFESEQIGQKEVDVILNEINDLKVSALKYISSENNHRDNDYYCNELTSKDFITGLFTEYPTWTNIMVDIFRTTIKVATSGRSEALFSDLRHITNIHRPITCQLFLSQYVNDYVTGAIITAMSDLKSDALNLPIVNDCKNIPKKIQSKTRGKFLEPCLDIEERHKRKKAKKVKLLRNANLEPLIEYNKQSYEFESSCMFDSIFELCSSSQTEFPHFKQALLESCSSHEFCLTKTVIDYLESGNERALRLKRLQHCLKYLECVDGVINVIINNISIADFVQLSFNECFLGIFYIKLQTEKKEHKLNLAQLQSYIKEYISLQKISKEVEPFVFIDITNFSNSKSIKLSDIPLRININRQKYLLSGAIAFKRSAYNKRTVHYFTYCRSLKNYWTKKDDEIIKLGKGLNVENLNEQISMIMYVQTIE